MIQIVRWEPGSKSVETMTTEQLAATSTECADSILWIDLSNPTAEEEAVIFGKFFPVHPLTLEDITKPRRELESGAHLPKVEEFANYLFVIVNPLPEDMIKDNIRKPLTNLNRTRPQLSAVLNKHLLITHHYAEMPCVADGQRGLMRHPENLGRGPDYVFHLILDGVVDEYSPVVEKLADQLDHLEHRMFKTPTRALLTKLLRLKRQVSFLRKTMILEREVLARLIRGEFELVDEREIVYYRNVFDHLVRYTELIESAREMVSDLLQTHLSATSNRLNEVMKTLTIISVIGAICTVIAGIYGMNFKNMPELEWQYGYPLALALMAASVLVVLGLFKWKKWL
jgi:magnesium transporter